MEIKTKGNYEDTLEQEKLTFTIKYSGEDKEHKTFSKEGLVVYVASISKWIQDKIKLKMLEGFEKGKPLHKLNIEVKFK